MMTPGLLGGGHTTGFPIATITNGSFNKSFNVVGTHSTDLIGAAAVRFIESYNANPPFFLIAAFNAPHDPYEAPAEWMARYTGPDGGPLTRAPANFLPRHPFDNGEMTVRDELRRGNPRRESDINADVASYYAMISHLDAWVGRITAALAQRARFRDTVVVFTSDNGICLGSHGLLGKGNLYEEALRVPLVIAGPGIAPGSSDAPVYLFDLFPTLLSFAQAEPPAPERSDAAARSFHPLLRSEPWQPRAASYHAYRSVQRAVRAGRWKLIEYNVGGRQRMQLFDLQADPLEQRDLSSAGEHAATRTHMRTLLREQRAAFGDNEDFWNPQRRVEPSPASVDRRCGLHVSSLK
jgi:arylsulfatase A-like enzyme